MEDNQNWIDTFFRLLDNGFAVVVALGFLWAAWQAGKWLGREILVPARDRAFQHLDNTNQALQGLCQTMDTLKDEVSSKQTQTGEKLNHIHGDVKAIKAHLKVPGEL